MKSILFICASNRDRSPALEKYFSQKYPKHAYSSAGINKHHCGKHRSHYLKQTDIDYADIVVYVEDGIKKAVMEKGFSVLDKKEVVLNLGHFERDDPNHTYLSRAEEIILPYLR